MAATSTDHRPRTFDLKVGEEGGLLIPPEMCAAFDLEPGDAVRIEAALAGMTVTPVVSDKEAEAFWGSGTWRELEEAEANIAGGRSTVHRSDEDFLAALDAERHANPRGGCFGTG